MTRSKSRRLLHQLLCSIDHRIADPDFFGDDGGSAIGEREIGYTSIADFIFLVFSRPSNISRIALFRPLRLQGQTILGRECAATWMR